MKSNLMSRLMACLFVMLSCGILNAQDFISISLYARTLKYDAKRDKIYATVRGYDNTYGNTLVKINPYSGAIEDSIRIGSEPNVMAMTKDTNYVYVGLDGASFVKRVDLSTFSIDRTISLGNDGSGPLYAQDLATSDLSPDLVIVARKRSPGGTPLNRGVVAYMYSNLLPGTMVSPGVRTGSIETPNDTNLVFAYDNESTAAFFRRISVDTTAGLTQIDVTAGMVLGTNFEYENGLLYSDRGNVADPYYNPPASVGTFAGLNWWGYVVEADAINNSAFYASVGNGIRIQRFNLQTQAFIDEIELPGSIPTMQFPNVLDEIRFGERGLAFVLGETIPTAQNGKVVLWESCMIKPGADITVQTLPQTQSVYVQDNMDLYIVAANNGGATGHNIILTDTLPAAFSVISSVAAAGNLQISNSIMTWTLDSLQAGDADTAIIHIQATAAGVFPNTVNAATTGFDCDAVNNIQTEDVEIRDTACAQFNIDLSLNDRPFNVGMPNTPVYWNLTNTGTVAGRSVVLTDTFDSSMQISSVYALIGSASVSGNVVRYSIDTFPPGANVIVNIFTQFNQVGTIHDTVHFSADNILCSNEGPYASVFEVSNSVGVSELKDISSLHIFPNPVTDDRFTLSFDAVSAEVLTATLMNVSGVVLLQQQLGKGIGKHTEVFDVKALPAGIYVLKLSNSTGQLVQKVIKR